MKAATHANRFQFLPLLVSLIITLSIAAVGAMVTIPQVEGQNWYATLNKPAFNPPNQLFGPVWTVLYIMIAVAAYLVWKKRNDTGTYHTTRVVYFSQLLLNFSWSIVFFGQHQILAALAIIIVLWLCILVNMYYFAKFNTTACWLLLPYLLWVTFATVLNFSIYMLNH